MGKNSIKYLVFMLILVFSFNGNVYAAQELSCLYENSGVADKVMLVQDKNGKVVVYKHDKNGSWEDYGWYVSDAVPKWGDVKTNKKGKIKVDTSNIDDDKKISNLTSCPTAKVTFDGGKIRFYKENVDGSYVWFKTICRLEGEPKYSAFVPKANDYDTSSTDVSGKTCSSFTTKEMWNAVNTEKHATSCLYASDVVEGCHIVRMDVDTNKVLHWVQAEPLVGVVNDIRFKAETESANVDSMFENFSGNCPDFIYVNRIVASGQASVSPHLVNTKVKFAKTGSFQKYNKMDQKGINQVTGGNLTGEVELNFQKIEILDCETLFGGSEELIDLLKFILNLIKVLVPLMVVGLGTLDFAKAMFAGSEDNMKKAQSKFVKRLVIAVAIFLIPSILKLVLGIASSIWGNIDANLCGLL